MSINLLETVQQNLGYPALQKISPNTQQVVQGENIAAEDKFSQAAIPAVLTGLYLYAQSDEGTAAILQNDTPANWLGKIFNENEEKAVTAVAQYAIQTSGFTIDKMNAIANESVKQVKLHLPAGASANEVRAFFLKQKNTILLHLLPDLQIGTLLHDNNLDDNTNKMDGGISGLIQNIGELFSGSGTTDEDNRTN